MIPFCMNYKAHLHWHKIFLSGKTGVNKNNFNPACGGGKTTRKTILHLDGVLHNSSIYQFSKTAHFSDQKISNT